MSGTKKLPLVLATLTPDQIDRAKEANGRRKQITHALICGDYGQMFGTERQCLKYYDVWKTIFRPLFSKVHQTKKHTVEDYATTENLVMRLIEADDRRAQQR
ncbi:hypothetical protein [Candidatus Poriferisodalis sp.]|uniref:hypothetical protein n=1 Tax=Candidatus Poriferisodalis sp. TaxID=3101277 RepID=UPI003B515A8D